MAHRHQLSHHTFGPLSCSLRSQCQDWPVRDDLRLRDSRLRYWLPTSHKRPYSIGFASPPYATGFCPSRSSARMRTPCYGCSLHKIPTPRKTPRGKMLYGGALLRMGLHHALSLPIRAEPPCPAAPFGGPATSYTDGPTSADLPCRFATGPS
jgi:hypothetical protein